MQIRPILGKSFPNNPSPRGTVIVQIAGQEMNGRSSSAGVVIVGRELSHVYALVTMSSWTFCLHVLVYIATLVYILSTLLYGSNMALFAPTDFISRLESPISVNG